MKRRDLINKIGTEAKRQGVSWALAREGANHTVYRLGDTMIPIPRHTEIGSKTSSEIMKQADRELGKGWWR